MKGLLIKSIIAVVFFVLGYVFYPTINSVQNEGAIESEIKAQSLIKNDAKRDVLQTFEPLASNKLPTVKKVQVPEAKNAKVEINLLTIEEQTTSLNVQEELEEIDETGVSIQEELVQWSAEHKKQIEQLIEANMQNESAEHMKAQISNGNDFLSKPPIMQDLIEDELWAYNMEQQLRLLIAQHELSYGFNLLNLSCRQLMCDIFGIEKESNTWIKLYFSLLQNAPNAEFPDANSGLKSIQYMQNDTSSQIRFKSN